MFKLACHLKERPVAEGPLSITVRSDAAIGDLPSYPDIAALMVPDKPFSLQCEFGTKSRDAQVHICLRFGPKGKAYSISGFPSRLSPDVGRPGRPRRATGQEVPRSPSSSHAPSFAGTVDWVVPSDPQGGPGGRTSLRKYSDPTGTFSGVLEEEELLKPTRRLLKRLQRRRTQIGAQEDKDTDEDDDGNDAEVW